MKAMIALVLSAILALAACSKNETANVSPADCDGGVAEITFTDPDHTRTFFDETATAEEWEKNITSLKILVYDSDGNFVLSRYMTSDEIAEKKALVALPKRLAGVQCTFVAVANTSILDVETLVDLKTESESEPSSYNGEFSTVSTSSARSAGFAMSGSTSATVAAEGSTTSVGVTLRRLTAKIAVRTSVGEDFGKKYQGTLSITSVEISKGARQALVLAPTSESEGEKTFSFSQTPVQSDMKLQSLFYLYPCAARTEGNHVTLHLKGTYDADNSAMTSSDCFEVEYTVELGDSSGAIARNGYYRVEITINGLEGEKCETTVSVSDWETPVTQDISLGF